jgi:hypothetical protein
MAKTPSVDLSRCRVEWETLSGQYSKAINRWTRALDRPHSPAFDPFDGSTPTDRTHLDSSSQVIDTIAWYCPIHTDIDKVADQNKKQSESNYPISKRSHPKSNSSLQTKSSTSKSAPRSIYALAGLRTAGFVTRV